MHLKLEALQLTGSFKPRISLNKLMSLTLEERGRGVIASTAGGHGIGLSLPSTFNCDYVAGTALAIGSTTTVACTATDAIGNESAASTFDVFVGLNVNGEGFLPPTYADGTPALDLAGGLRLVIKRLDGATDPDGIGVDDYSAGSTAWHYDDGHYIFNLKTGTTSPTWDPGSWTTTVSYAGIPLATTQFDLRR